MSFESKGMTPSMATLRESTVKDDVTGKEYTGFIGRCEPFVNIRTYTDVGTLQREHLLDSVNHGRLEQAKEILEDSCKFQKDAWPVPLRGNVDVMSLN